MDDTAVLPGVQAPCAAGGRPRGVPAFTLADKLPVGPKHGKSTPADSAGVAPAFALADKLPVAHGLKSMAAHDAAMAPGNNHSYGNDHGPATAQDHATRHATRRPGFVLIMVMVVLTGLALVAFHLAARCRMRLAEVSGAVRAAQAKWLAHAAVQRGIVAIEADQNEWDWLGEPWAQLGGNVAEKWFSHDIEGLGKDLLASCSVADEHAKINVRALAGAAQAAQLGGWGERLSPLLADWMDDNEDRRADGAESADYAEAAGEGYAAKNRPLEVLEELRFLKGMSPEAMLGEDSNGNGTLDAWEDDGPARLPMDNADGLLDRGPWSLLTCAGDGKININTAPLEVLATMAPLTREDAEAIVAHRESRQQGSSSQPPFKTVQELVDQVRLAQWKVDSLQSALCTASKDFRVAAIVRDTQGRSVARHEVLVVREDGRCKVRMYGGW